MYTFPELVPFIAGNQQWVANTTAAEPEFLPKLAAGQAPPVLWIGCADSRIPETTLCGAKPGDIFVHVSCANPVMGVPSRILGPQWSLIPRENHADSNSATLPTR